MKCIVEEDDEERYVDNTFASGRFTAAFIHLDLRRHWHRKDLRHSFRFSVKGLKKIFLEDSEQDTLKRTRNYSKKKLAKDGRVCDIMEHQFAAHGMHVPLDIYYCDIDINSIVA